MTARIALIALLCIASAGCGQSDPTPESFEKVAVEFGKRATRERTRKSGHVFQQIAKLKKYDLRKTDSLVSPFVADAVYDVTLKGINISHPDIPGYAGIADYHCDSNVQFAFQDGRWVAKEESSVIRFVDVAGISDSVRAKIGTMGSSKLFQSTIDESDIVLGHYNGFALLTPQQAEARIVPGNN